MQGPVTVINRRCVLEAVCRRAKCLEWPAGRPLCPLLLHTIRWSCVMQGPVTVTNRRCMLSAICPFATCSQWPAPRPSALALPFAPAPYAAYHHALIIRHEVSIVGSTLFLTAVILQQAPTKARLASPIPLVGDSIVAWVWGGLSGYVLSAPAHDICEHQTGKAESPAHHALFIRPAGVGHGQQQTLQTGGSLHMLIGQF